MKDKHMSVLEELFADIEAAHHALLTELAMDAIDLGYKPVRNKTSDITIDFRNSRTKKSIMKLEAHEQKHDGYGYRERNVPGLRLRFFAAKDYSDIFKHGIKRVIEDFGGRYTGCYGCGRCDGTEGYTYIYPDGREVFRCGSEFISIFDFTEGDLPEIKKLMKMQADYYEKKTGK